MAGDTWGGGAASRANAPTRFSSTARDPTRGKHREINYLTGVGVRRGPRVARPVKWVLNSPAKLLERA